MAIQEIESGRKIPIEREPHRHQIFYNGKSYPPKFVISLANKYANGGQELESTEFSGGSESNNFLTARGFEIRPVGDKLAVARYDDDILDYLRSNFNADIDKLKRSWLQFSSSGTTLYVNGSKKHEKGDEGWYDLEKVIYEDLFNNSHSYYVILLGDVLTTFVIPSNVLKDIFGSQYTIDNGVKNQRWMFTILHGSQGYTIRINGDRKTDFPIDKYLNNWKQIPDLGSNTVRRPKIYVTGYSKVNLDHSLEKGILGWRNQSRMLSRGDYVFVYDTNSHMIQAAFLILGASENNDPIWLEELNSKSRTDDIVFPNRWDAKIIRDNLQIDLDTIGNFEPFNGNPQNKFIPLIGNNSPTPLSDNKYFNFNNFLLDKIEGIDNKGIESQQTYWKIAPGKDASKWSEQSKNDVVAIGWNEIGNLDGRKFEDISEDIKKRWPDSYQVIIPQIRDFLSIKQGDIIVANKGISQIVGIGRVTGNYKFRPDLTFHHTYPTQWFDTLERKISPQNATWRKTVSQISPTHYNQIVNGTPQYYVLVRHQPEFKRKKTERQYWNDLLGKEYHFGKKVVNYKKMVPGSRTVWFYANNDKLYFWGHGLVSEVRPSEQDQFIAYYDNFELFDRGGAVEAKEAVETKIKSLMVIIPLIL